MGLPVYKEMTEITLNCVIKENPIAGRFQIKIDKNDFICSLRETIRKNQSGIFIHGSLGVKLWKVDIDPDNTSVLGQLSNTDSTVESVITGSTAIIDGFHKVEKYFSNPDPNKIHLIVQAVPNWCDICNQGLVSKKGLVKHSQSIAHSKRLDRERKVKNPPDPGSDVEDYDEGNEDNSISLTSNDIIAFNREIDNLGPGDEDGSDAGYDTP